MDSSRVTPNGERHSLVPNGTSTAAPGSRRSSLAVPQLDEESLKANGGGSGGGGGFTLVSQSDDGFHGGLGLHGHETNLHSPDLHTKGLDRAQIYSMLQQQQAVAMAAAQLEQAYNQTCYLLQQCSPHALLTVLMSLLNDYPTTLVQPIRARVEQVLAQQMSPSASSRASNSARKPGSSFVPNSSAAPWTPSHMHGGSAAPTPTANSASASHRRGRGHKGKEEEQELCSIHNNMRAMKHLQLNQSTGLYECIHGFHCLVDGPAELSPRRAAATTPSLSNSASRGSNPPTMVDSQAYVPAVLQPVSAQPQSKPEGRFSATEMEALRMIGFSMGNSNNTSSHPQQQQQQQHDNGAALSAPLSMALHRDPDSGLAERLSAGAAVGGGGGGGGYTVVGHDRSSSTGTSPLDARLNMDLPSLEYLLQSVRDIDDD